MRRTAWMTVLAACGILATGSSALAQSGQPVTPENWFTGTAQVMLLGRDDVSSSKFEEYRVVPKGVSMPYFALQGYQGGTDFALVGRNIAQQDQRWTGWTNFGWVGIAFDYNEIPHGMGNNGRTFLTETAPGVWSMSGTLRQTLGDAVDATPTSGRNYLFYSNLLAPTLASAGSIDLDALRQRGEVVVDFSRNLPFDFTFTYMRELKSGTRGASSGDILGVVTSAIDVAEPLNEVTQDFGFRLAYNFKAGNIHGTFNRNIYNDRVDALVVDNPFRATDRAYTSTSVPGGPAQARFSTSPDNEASRGAFGVLLKFARQTRITGDVAFSTWTQDAPFLPYTINSAILTPAGAAANSLSSLQATSLGGKINTTLVNLGFVSRPVEGLGIRLRYRSYDLANKTTPIVWAGSTSGSPDRSWDVASPSADAPNGYITANLYDNKTATFSGQVSYDIKDLTVEGSFRASSLDRTYREATTGQENSYGFAAVYHAADWLGFRGYVDRANRSAEGETVYGFQSDEAERETTRTGINVELTPGAGFGVTFAYVLRDVTYPDRPDRVQVSGGVPVAGAAPIPGTPSGLLEASYDAYTVEVDYAPNARAQFGAYYTYEKNASTNQWHTTTGAALNNSLRYEGSDKGNTFGASVVFQLVPEKWTCSLFANHQKVDGLMDITAREAGSFYTPGRTGLVPPGTGGAQDIVDYDDTRLTIVKAQLDYNVAEAWTFSGGYWYEKYTYADAMTSGTSNFPQSVLFFLKADDGDYKAGVGYLKLTYRF